MNYKTSVSLLIFIICIAVLAGCDEESRKSKTIDYPISPISFTRASIHDSFWLPRIKINTEVTIPIAFQQSEETGRIKNFEVAGGLTEGSFCSKYPFDDSDVFKIMEGAAYSLMIYPDEELESYLDTLISKISAAQEEDGYLYTNRTILGDSVHDMAGPERWSQVTEHSHELYNVGHMYEAAVAHYQATGKRSFLDIAIKNADLIHKEFGWGKIEKYPGHQEIEIGLVKLYRETGDNKYLDLAKFFLDVRGPDGWDYNQAHQIVTDQTKPVGHAVRALYMYSGMADVAALKGDTTYINAIQRIWQNVVTKKMYITGGIGQSGGNEGFGNDYELPNKTAYCETCASIANVFWNQRMFLLSGNAQYIDVLERTLYNALLSGVSLTGDLFFYPNPLESNGDHHRKKWFGCACCPSNISRFLPSIPGYIYARKNNKIFVNLFISSETTIDSPDGKIELSQKSNYPWDGQIAINVVPEKEMKKTLCIRIPGWANEDPVPGDLYHYAHPSEKKATIHINGKQLDFEIADGYAIIEREWNKMDKIEVHLPMPVRKVYSHKKVKENEGRFALQRGTVVYCLEGVDQPGLNFDQVVISQSSKFTTRYEAGLLNGVQTIEINLSNGQQGATKMKAIPYCVWANREPGRMMVWMPFSRKNE